MTAADLAAELRWIADALAETMDSPEPGKVSHAHDMARNTLARHSADEWNAAHPIGTIVEFWYGDGYGPARKKTTGAAYEWRGLAWVEVDGREMPVEELKVVAS